MKATILNWTGNDALEVEAREAFEAQEQKIPALVGLHQSAGGMRFYFSMTAKQARDMAVALLEAADEIEGKF